MKFVAFLRGINVGGKSMVKMEDLRNLFEKIGFTDVKTVLNSGNIVFVSQEKDATKLTEKIEDALKQKIGREISVLLRSVDEIQKLITSDPFKDIPVTKETRLYVTFFSLKPESSIKVPYESPEKDLKILRLTDTELCCVAIISPERNTTDMMGFVEKEFGKKVTTRNWNTIVKIAALGK